MVDWEMHALEFGNCNCSYGCPCQFNARPTHGDCRAVAFFHVDNGHFGGARLDGLNFAMAIRWPGAVHEGRGQMQPIIAAEADEAQRRGLLSIMSGKETDEMATFFAVYAATCERIHDPVYTKITIEADMSSRTARCEAQGSASGRGAPIVNPVTGREHRVGIVLPNGFEYTQNEVGRGWSQAGGAVPFALDDSYAQWCELHLNRHGVIRQ